MSGCFALQSAANRVVRTIVTAIHDKILIPRLTAAAAVTVRRERERERSETAFLNIIRPGAFYYSTRDRSGRQEFDPATLENFHRIHRIRGGFAPLFRSPFSLSSSLLFFHEYVPIDADRIGRIMLLRRQNEVSRSSPSTGVLVFYVKTEQFYSTSSNTLFFSLHMFSFFSSSPSLPLYFSSHVSLPLFFRDLSYRQCHKFHPRYPPCALHCYSPIYSDILELNLVPATHFEALPRLLWLTYLIRISRIPISRPQCASIDTFANYIFVRVT